MKRGRLPLTALRSFEVAARHGSFTRAASELFISQAAISRQVRELEASIARPLFERRHRAVVLTPAGEELRQLLTASFDSIGDCLDRLRSSDEQPALIVSCEPSFASCWLMPHLADFQHLHPGIDLDIDTDRRFYEFRGGDPAIAIRHSETESRWPRVESRPLFKTRLTPVLSPSLLRDRDTLQQPEQLLAYPLVHEERRDLWAQWFAAAGIAAPATAQRGLVFAEGGLTLQAALRGQGVALTDDRLASDALARGELIRPFGLTIPFGAYWLVARRFATLPPSGERFVTWVEGHFRA